MIRTLLALVAALLSLSAAPALAQTAAPQAVELPAANARTIPVSVWAAENERGVIVFSHGFHGSPAAYQRIISAWTAHGFTIVAPTHVDSLQHPNHAAYDNSAAFMTRIEDLALVRQFIRETRPGRPMIAAGHSFGSLMSLIEGGAVTVAGPWGDPDVRGVIAFSSAGSIPGVVTPRTYEDLSAPLLIITGDADVVPGWVADPAAHRIPFDQSPPGGRTLITFAGGDHELVARADDADFAVIVEATLTFLDAYALSDAEALARLNGLSSSDGVTIEHR